jgi:hypothetical protein
MGYFLMEFGKTMKNITDVEVKKAMKISKESGI